MGVRYRKSVKVAPGVKLNVSRKSASVTIGGKGVRKTFSSTGRRTTSVKLPVSGLSYTSTKSSSSKRKKSVPPSSNPRSACNISSNVDANQSSSVAKDVSPKVKAKLLDKPNNSTLVFGIIILVVGLALLGTSIILGVVIALIGALLIYTFVDFKRHPDNPKYITDEQSMRWSQLVLSDKKSVFDLQKASLPIMLDLKSRTGKYFEQLKCATRTDEIERYSELLLSTQQKLVDLSEFVVIKGDNPKMDYERYYSLVQELK